MQSPKIYGFFEFVNSKTFLCKNTWSMNENIKIQFLRFSRLTTYIVRLYVSMTSRTCRLQIVSTDIKDERRTIYAGY